jgi:hypothetical protein
MLPVQMIAFNPNQLLETFPSNISGKYKVPGSLWLLEKHKEKLE